MEKFHLRKATVDDALALAQVQFCSWKETYRGLLANETLENLSIDKFVLKWKKILQSNDARATCFVAEFVGEIVGFISCGPQQAEDMASHGEYRAIYVLAHAQKLGIGYALFNEAKIFLRKNFDITSLWVLKSNAKARAFYEKQGGRAAQGRLHTIGKQTVEDVLYVWES